jgi:hypothetical protein
MEEKRENGIGRGECMSILRGGKGGRKEEGGNGKKKEGGREGVESKRRLKKRKYTHMLNYL